MEDTKKCPYCGEEIKAIAKKCRFCGQWLDEETSETAPKQEEVKVETKDPVEQPAPKETGDIKRNETVSKSPEESKKNGMYWVVGIIAAVLLLGLGFMLGDKGSDNSVAQEQSEAPAIEESDPKAKIKQHVEAIYSDVFSSPDANCESRYLTSDFYNLYVQARDLAASDVMQWKKLIWLNGEEWREMTAKVTDIRDLPAGSASVYVELTDNSGNSIKDILLHVEDATGSCRIKDISYKGLSVKDGIESYVGKNKQAGATDPYDASNDKYDHWQGMYAIDGYKYRTCATLSYLNLEKNGSDTYKGTVSISLGDFFDDGSGRFDPYYGSLEGNVRAKADENTLLVSIVDYKVIPGSNENFFSERLGHPQFKTGDQIFLITYNGKSYTTKAVGKLEHDYDGGDIVTKRR